MINVPEEIKNLLKQGSIRKNFRVKFPNGEHSDLTNENIISESVSLTESLCSQDTLKFGLCEASTISFQTFGVGNIKGKTIDCQIEIDCSSLDAEFIEENCTIPQDLGYPVYAIPYGRFIVDKCDRDSGNMQQRKMEAFSLELNLNDTKNEYVEFLENTPVSDNEAQEFDVYEYLTYYLYKVLDNIPESINRDTESISKALAEHHTQVWTSSEQDQYTIEINTPQFYNSSDDDNAVTENWLKGSKLIASDNTQNRLFLNLYIKGKFFNDRIPNSGINSIDVPELRFGNAKELALEVSNNVQQWADTIEAWGYQRDIRAQIDRNWILELWEGLGYLWVSDNEERIIYDITDGKNALDNPSYYNYQPYSISPTLLIPYYRSPSITTTSEYAGAKNVLNNELFRLGGRCLLFVPTQIVMELNSYTNGTRTDIGSSYNTLEGIAIDLFNGDFSMNSIAGSELCEGLGLTSDTYKLSFNRSQQTDSNLYAVKEDKTDKMELLKAFCELSAAFGKVSRSNKAWEFISIQQSVGVYPSEDLYPNHDIYPNGHNSLVTQMYDKSMYSKAWYSDYPTELYSGASFTYTLSDSDEITITEYLIEPDSPFYTGKIYDLSENIIIQNYISTSQIIQESRIHAILREFLSKIRIIRYMPADIDCIGLPYVNVGDSADVITSDGAFETLILRRTLAGIQALSDNIESKG